MVAATAAWVVLLVPTFIYGNNAAYAVARGGEGTNHFIVGNRIVTQSQMASIASWNGVEFVGCLTLAWVAAVAIGCIMVMSLERRPV